MDAAIITSAEEVIWQPVWFLAKSLRECWVLVMSGEELWSERDLACFVALYYCWVKTAMSGRSFVAEVVVSGQDHVHQVGQTSLKCERLLSSRGSGRTRQRCKANLTDAGFKKLKNWSLQFMPPPARSGSILLQSRCVLMTKPNTFGHVCWYRRKISSWNYRHSRLQWWSLNVSITSEWVHLPLNSTSFSPRSYL